MNSYICSVCGGNCDPGELIGGICIECLEEKRIAVETHNKIASLLNAQWVQMTLNLGGNTDGHRNC